MKKRNGKIIVCGIFVCLFLFSPLIFAGLPAVQAGTIKGQVTCKGVRTNQGAVVYIDTIKGKDFPSPKEPVLNDQKAKEFVPHILPILKGTTVDFLNSDPFAHNVFSPDEVADEFDLGSWGRGEKRSYTFNKLGEAVILCNLHPEMEGWIVVLPTPYFSVTDKDGNYVIENVPEGTYTLKTWHKKLKSSAKEFSVASLGSVKVDFLIKR